MLVYELKLFIDDKGSLSIHNVLLLSVYSCIVLSCDVFSALTKTDGISASGEFVFTCTIKPDVICFYMRAK